MANVVQPNPATVEALLDTTWRLSEAEASRTDSLDGKAATLATFASLLASLTAGLGGSFVGEAGSAATFAVFCSGLFVLVVSVGLAVGALVPREYLTLGMPDIERFPTWSEIRKTPQQLRGELLQVLVDVIARERELNDRKAGRIRVAFLLLFCGLVILAAEAATLSAGDTFR